MNGYEKITLYFAFGILLGVCGLATDTDGGKDRTPADVRSWMLAWILGWPFMLILAAIVLITGVVPGDYDDDEHECEDDDDDS